MRLVPAVLNYQAGKSQYQKLHQKLSYTYNCSVRKSTLTDTAVLVFVSYIPDTECEVVRTNILKIADVAFGRVGARADCGFPKEYARGNVREEVWASAQARKAPAVRTR